MTPACYLGVDLAWREARADLPAHETGVAAIDPPLRLDPHPVTRRLAAEPSPAGDAAYKHREDLIDALLCAWTASLGRATATPLPGSRPGAVRRRRFGGYHHRSGPARAAKVALQ